MEVRAFGGTGAQKSLEQQEEINGAVRLACGLGDGCDRYIFPCLQCLIKDGVTCVLAVLVCGTLRRFNYPLVAKCLIDLGIIFI